MSELARRLNQCRKPNGNLGRTVVDDMNSSHYELTGWGINKLEIKNTYSMLDIGCGGGITVNRLSGLVYEGEVYGIDYSDDCVKWASEYNEELIKKGRVHIYKGNVEKLAFEDNKFNIVTAVETVYFWPNISSCFKEVHRVLKAEGTFLIVNELYDSEVFRKRNNEFIELGNMNIYSVEQLKELLKNAGFKNVDIDTVEDKNWLRVLATK